MSLTALKSIRFADIGISQTLLIAVLIIIHVYGAVLLGVSHTDKTDYDLVTVIR